MQIILATHNAHKAEELAAIFDPVPVKTMSDFGLFDDIVEDGETIEENARIKVETLKRLLPESVLAESILMADDTGLFVDYLSGAPGVYSARYAGENCSYDDNNKKLLDELEGVEDRDAYFSTALAVVTPEEEFTVTSKVEGRIAEVPDESGSGFGYDPVFIEKETGLTYSRMGDEEKNRRSHRRAAVDLARKRLDL